MHYLIKVQIVKDLKARLQSGCEQCQMASALQLALCAELAFGTSRDLKMSQKWLQESGKKRADILKLCYEAAHYSVTYKTFRRLFDGYVDSYDPIAANLFDLYKSDGLIRETISSYEEEIAGRTASGSIVWLINYILYVAGATWQIMTLKKLRRCSKRD